jgi:site-specific recombinase XerD
LENDLLSQFEHYLNDNNSPVSVKGYLSDIRAFIGWAKDHKGIELNRSLLKSQPHLLNKAVIDAYLKHLHAEKYALNTIARHGAAMRVFGTFLLSSGVVPVNPAEKIKNVKPDPSDPRGLDDDQRAKLEYVFRTPWERAANKTARRKEKALAPKLLIRDRAMMLTMMYAGPRVSELIGLDVSDVTIKERSGNIIIRDGKGGKPRVVDIPRQVREAIADWLDVRREFPAADDALFISLKRGYSRITQRTVQLMLEEASKRSGVEVTPHILRHTYAYMLMKNGTHPKTAAALMGHSLEMALRYGSSKEEDKRKAVDGLDDLSTF